jgi:CheY-like chemotaxis protein/HPt (histidine-containing phosphotransfer) domain-containing protein
LNEAKRASGRRILIVEDNQVNQQVAFLQLKQLGYKADVAANGREALDAMLKTDYAAVLMDCQMPIMDGLEATRVIRQTEEGVRHTPIIAMTANAMEGEREKCLEAGMDDYISKPVKRDLLQEMLGKWTASESTLTDKPVATPAIELALEFAGEDLTSARARLKELGDEFGPEMVNTLAEMFVTDTQTRLAALRRSIEQCDPKALEREAHGLKGSAANLGVVHMAKLCAALEERAADLISDGALGMMSDLESGWNVVQAAFRPAADLTVLSGIENDGHPRVHPGEQI